MINDECDCIDGANPICHICKTYMKDYKKTYYCPNCSCQYKKSTKTK